MKKEKNKALPYAVLGLKISNYAGIKETEVTGLPDSAQWIFLTGENGFGKTTVLQALAAVLYKLRPEVKFSYKLKAELWESEKNERVSKTLDNLFIPKSNETQSGDFSVLSLLRFADLEEFSKICAYGSSRLNINPSEDDKELENPIAGLFDTKTILLNIEHQISRWHFKQSDPEFKAKYENTIEVFKKLLPIKKIEVDKKTDKITYWEKDEEGKTYEPVEFRQLASGFKSLIALVGDMILRLFKTQPKVHDPRELEGIVLIDELDLHFHPNMQRELPSLLSNIFPKIQFIASTHSPIPILGAPAGSVFLTVKRSKEEGVTVHRIDLDISNLTPNLILTSPIFGFDNIFAETYSSNQRVRTEDSLHEKNVNDAVLSRLQAFAEEDAEIYQQVFKEKTK